MRPAPRSSTVLRTTTVPAQTSAPARKAAATPSAARRRQHAVLGREPEPRRPRAGGRRRGVGQLGSEDERRRRVAVRVDEDRVADAADVVAVA